MRNQNLKSSFESWNFVFCLEEDEIIPLSSDKGDIPEEKMQIETCLNCCLPDCKPESAKCPLNQKK